MKLLKSPEIRELTLIGGHAEHRVKYWETIEAITTNINEYLNRVLATKGSRSTGNEQAYRTVLAACAGQNIVANRNICRAAGILVSASYSFFGACNIPSSHLYFNTVVRMSRAKTSTVVYGTDTNSKRHQTRVMWCVLAKHTAIKCPTK